MLKIISSKNDNLIFSEIRKNKVKEKISGNTQDIALDLAESKAEDISIFGDTEAFLINITTGEVEKLETFNFSILEKSIHFFFIVGNGAEFEKTIDKQGQKHNFVKLIEKAVSDFPVEMVAAIQKNDKKNAWSFMMKALSNKDAEPVHGSCIFAYKSLLVYLNDTKKNSELSGVKDYPWSQAKRNGGNRQKQEVIDKYFELVLNYHKARAGKGDLAKQLEMWVLGS